MGISTVSSREFNDDAGRAKGVAATGPLFITDRDRPTDVLSRIEDYQQLVGGGATIVDLLSAGADDAIEFAPSPMTRDLPRPADLD